MESSLRPVETAVLRKYLLAHSTVFRDFDSWDDKVAKDSDLDRVYREKTRLSNVAKDKKDESVFFPQYQKILRQIFPEYEPFFEKQDILRVLDICMAPGGFAYAILSRHGGAEISGITLPPSDGGHLLQDKGGLNSLEYYRHRYKVQYLDITKLAVECGVTPESLSALKLAHDYLAETPYETVEFDLVMGDGVVLDFQKQLSPGVKADTSRRLLLSELILGMQRIKHGGTFMILLHRLSDWSSVTLVKDFNGFATVRLWKPTTTYNHRSSFYLIAENVQPKSSLTLNTVRKWRQEWEVRTLNYVKTTMEAPASSSTPQQLSSVLGDVNLNSTSLFKHDVINSSNGVDSETEVDEFLKSRGKWLIALGEPVWNTQRNGLQNLYEKTKARAQRIAPQSSENVPQSLMTRFGPESWIAKRARAQQAARERGTGGQDSE